MTEGVSDRAWNLLMEKVDRTDTNVSKLMDSLPPRLETAENIIGAAAAWQEQHDKDHGKTPGVAPDKWIANIWTLMNAHKGKLITFGLLIAGALSGIVKAAPFLTTLVRLAR